jgi:LuxR family maltose regulon positive regulatory protein
MSMKSYNDPAGNDGHLVNHRHEGVAVGQPEDGLSAVSAGKFKAPHTDSNCHLMRQRILEILPAQQAHRKKSVFIEAKAGEGKSILAAQYLRCLNVNHLWYQIDSRDQDPVTLMESLVSVLAMKFAGLRNGSLFKLMASGALTSHETDHAAKLLSTDLKPLVAGPFCLVFDDLHLIQEVPPCMAFVNALIESAPPPLRFVFISRHGAPSLSGKTEMTCIGTDTLAMTPEEIAELYSRLFGLTLPAAEIASVHAATGGWMMGVILLAQAFTRSMTIARALPNYLAETTHPDGLWNYFETQIVSTLAPSQRQMLLNLSLLETIPVSLARQLFNASAPVELLASMVSRHLFVRRVAGPEPIYILHHLFQESLRHQAAHELQAAECIQTLSIAGNWAQQNHQMELALHYFLRAGHYDSAEKLLLEIGFKLLNSNRIASLKSALDQIPAYVIRNSGWLLLFYGNCLLYTDPPQALSHLEQANQIFVSRGDNRGEFFTLVALITFHMGIDCRFNRGLSLLERAQSLYAELAKGLSVHNRLRSIYAIAYGLLYFAAQYDRAKNYLEQAAGIANTLGFDDTKAGVAFARLSAYMFEANFACFSREIEESLDLLSNPSVSRFYRLGLMMMQAIFLTMKGDTAGYRYQRSVLKKIGDTDLQSKTIVGRYLFIMDASMALAEGNLDLAMEHAQDGLASGGANATAHLQSQFFASLAYLHALKGDAEAAVRASKQSEKLRDLAGGPLYKTRNQLMIGGVYAHLGQADHAERYLAQAIASSDGVRSSFIRAGAHAHLALTRLDKGKLPEALESVGRCLRLMIKGKYSYFFGWNPQLMKPVLAAAVSHGIESEFARKLAAEQLNTVILPDGKTLPLLEINTLGRLELVLGRQQGITFFDLTPTQRELIAMLVAAPQQTLSLEQIGDTLWPDSSQAKIRSKFDNLIFRLRKTLDRLFSPFSTTDYLVVSKGYVHLCHCRIDASMLLKLLEKGWRHVQRAERWQADIAFAKANELYQGEYLPTVRLRPPAAIYRDRLFFAYLDMAREWIKLLTGCGRLEQAVMVAGKVMRNDPLNESIARTLYDLYASTGEPVKARHVLSAYREALEKEGFSPREISEMMDAFWQLPDP